MLTNYKLSLTIDDRTIEIAEKVETNYLQGQALQLAHLFYRCTLATGFSPAVASEAMGKVAATAGYDPEEFEGDLFGQGSGEGGEKVD